MHNLIICIIDHIIWHWYQDNCLHKERLTLQMPQNTYLHYCSHSEQFMQGKLSLRYSLKWHHSSEHFPMSSLVGENIPKYHFVSILKWTNNFGLAVYMYWIVLYKTVQRGRLPRRKFVTWDLFKSASFETQLQKNWAWSCYLRPLQKQFLCHLVTQMHQKLTFT